MLPFFVIATTAIVALLVAIAARLSQIYHLMVTQANQAALLEAHRNEKLLDRAFDKVFNEQPERRQAAE